MTRLQELIAEARAKVAASQAAATSVSSTIVEKQLSTEVHQQFAETDDWEWNPEQKQAIDMALSGKSFNLIGAAGTGKTTTLREIIKQLIAQDKVPLMGMSTKFLLGGLPGIVLTSFTRRAVRNIRKAVAGDLGAHCLTRHKLLEFEPVFYDVWDEVAQKNRVTMRFEPARNNKNKLPAGLKTIVTDESSMVSVDLEKQTLSALYDSKGIQQIFLGDLHQLPPVYGQAILGFKLLELPTVELTKIYRQAAKSPIITLAHKIKDGLDIPIKEQTIMDGGEHGKVTIRPWKKPISDFDATHTASAFLKELVKSGNYDEENDIILCPQEKTKNLAFGTNEFNKVIAQSLGEQRSATVFEIIAGFAKLYLAVGDRILVGREDATITKITKNAKYWGGQHPRPASADLDRWGNYRKKVQDSEADALDVDSFLDNFTLTGNVEEDRKQEASHIIEIQFIDSDIVEVLSSAGELNAIQFAYCLTVHKSQGSEWQRVFFLTHQSHITMWSRELLYTAVTRARKELYMIVEPDRGNTKGTLWKAAKSPRIKGNTLEEKAEFFKGKEEEYKEKMKDAWEPGESFAGKKAVKRESSVAPIQAAPEPVKLVRLCEFVSQAFRDEANKRLATLWEKATAIWGNKIGNYPKLDYNLQRAKTIGLARLDQQMIFLNPVWCILADEHPIVKEEMLGETLTHEVCHLIAWNYSKDRGHDSGWRMAMKLMGIPEPQQYYVGDTLPTWATAFHEIALKKLHELKSTKNADTSVDFVTNSYDEV